MKKLSLVVGLVLISGSALASKARLGALGEDVFGSQFIDDNRNMFLNPANIHNYKNMATFEWGNTSAATGNPGNFGADTVSTPKAEGGVVMSHGSMVYGLYLGDESNDSHGFRAAAGVGDITTGETPKEENAIGAFIGGEHGVKWGASFTYSHTGRDEGATGQQLKLQDAMRTRFGAIINENLDVFAQINLQNRAEDAAGDKFKGKLGFQTGATYKINKYKVFGVYKNLDGENQSEKSIHVGSYEVGVGRTEKLNDKVTLFTKVSYANFNSDNANSANTNFATGLGCNSGTTVVRCREYLSKRVPLVVGFEADATSWLVLRGSVSQNLWSVEENANEDKRTIANSTAVNAGASLKLGDITVDGLVGNNTTGAAPGATTANGAGQLRLDSLMSRVSMTYRF